MDIQQGAIDHPVRVEKVSGARATVDSPWIEVSGRPVSVWMETGDSVGMGAVLQGSWNGIDTVDIGVIASGHHVFAEMGWPLVRVSLNAISSGQLGNVYVMALKYAPPP